MSNDTSELAHRPARTCSSCGRILDASELAFGDPPTCVACLFGRHDGGNDDDDDGHRQRLRAALDARLRLGLALGNGGPVPYADGIDPRLGNVLDALRRHVVAVRIELEVEGEAVVLDGHLRRVGDGGGDGEYPRRARRAVITDAASDYTSVGYSPKTPAGAARNLPTCSATRCGERGRERG